MPTSTAVPASTLKELGEAIASLGARLSLRLPAGSELRVVTAAQSALLDFLADNPYCTIAELDVHAGDPDLVKLRLNEAATRKIRLGGKG